jgi:hypothetical protein
MKGLGKGFANKSPWHPLSAIRASVIILLLYWCLTANFYQASENLVKRRKPREMIDISC